MQVEVDPADPGRRPRSTSYVATSSCHVGGVGDLDVLDVEEPAGHVEQPGPHLREVEVGPDLLGVDVEPLAAQHLGVEQLVDAVDGAELGVVLPQAGQQHVEVAAGRRRRQTSVIRSMNSGIAAPLPIILTSAS